MMTCIFYFGVVAFVLINKLHGDDSVTYPTFPRQAEFIIETITNDTQYQRTFAEYIYDYDSNRLIIINERTSEYYNYTTRQKAIYSRNNLRQCDVHPIDVDNPFDPFSAVINLNDNSTHIRLLNEFLRFPLNANYFTETILRGIHVNQWIASVSDLANITWSFAKPIYVMPWNSPNYVIPVQGVMKRKDNGGILQVFNVLNYKTIITRTDLTPPRGIYCDDLVQQKDMLSLQDIGMKFPDIFSVRIDASTTSQNLWHSVHLRYHIFNNRKLIRYDYTPSDNSQNPVSMILDYADGANRAYRIDRRTGSCTIDDSVEIILMTSILHNPIEAFIKYENLLISNPPHHLFQYSGNRPCRGSISCSILIGQMPNFPTDTEEDWLASTIEWGWSKRNIDDDTSSYDYPVYLNLNLYKKTNEPPSNVHYEFYDYRTDVHLNEFDINLCYRSNQLSYQHLAFQLKIQNHPTGDDLENNYIDRRRLITFIRSRMVRIMTIQDLRISQIELDHHPNQPGHNDTLYCVFTLLDRTPFVNPTSEIGLLEAQQNLKNDIDQGEFEIEINDGIWIKAVVGSLESIEYFYAFNSNVSINQIDYFVNTTIHVNRTVDQIIEQFSDKIQYSDGAQAGAVIGGMIVGILTGILIIFVLTQMINRKTNTSPTGGLAFRNISFRIPKPGQRDIVTMEHPIDV